ncbi:MAG: broad specificity phosphatase PhoE [Paracoccaceae bacterium]|jgi:broad specificity phosphatase PhoE
MAMPPIYILRHGETEWNRERRVQGTLDSTLTVKGRRQAAMQGTLLGPILANSPAATIYCSPQGRAQTTANIALAEYAVQPLTEPRLREVNMGDWQGQTHPEIAAHSPDRYFAHDTVFDLSLNTPGGERYSDLAARSLSFLDDLTGPSVVVTHGITSIALRGLLLGLQYSEMAALDHEQGCIYVIEQGTETVLRLPTD